MSRSNTRLVYSSDGSHLKSCKKCGESPCVCRKSVTIIPVEHTLKIRLEKKGRGGKSVTVVFDLPSNDAYFKDLSKKLKAHCGTGGSFKEGMIEIQGDQREKTKSFLEKMGFSIKL
ncbi:MAG: translation initiation factor, partial [Bdellovibrionales bacterium]|nr:translation initiation factor [Bdellovibrionales bacterium]